MKSYNVENAMTSPELGQAHFLGQIEERLQRFVYERMESDDAVNVTYMEAENAFRTRIDDASGIIGIWQGEFWGKLMISAVRVCRYKHSVWLKDFLHRAALNLIACQDPDGYIGTYKNNDNVLAADPVKTRPVMGWDCNWNWNIWCRKYTLWGLLEIYELTEDNTILNACIKFTDHLIAQLKRLGLRLCETGTFNGLPSCSIIKPMLVLYRITDDKRYLQFAVDAAESWDDPSGRCPNLIANARSGKPLHEWYPNSLKWAKAYELMSCLDGLLELYRVTGTRKYFDTVQIIQGLLKKYELNQVGNVAFNDVFGNASAHINSISEPCDAVHWMRVNYELFMLTEDPKYIDDFETVFLNTFLASVFRDGKWGGRGVRSQGRHLISRNQAGFKHNHCCVNNLPRGFMNAAQLAVTTSLDTVFVNLFTPFTASTDKGLVRIGGNFPAGGDVNVEITPAGDAVSFIAFRIPRWSKHTTISCDGKTFTPEAGTFFRLPLDGKFRHFDIHFDMTPVVHDFPLPVTPDLPPSPYAVRWANLGNEGEVPYERMLKAPKATITCGPIILARSKDIGNTVSEMFSDDTVFGQNASVTLESFHAEGTLAAFTATVTAKGKAFTTPVCDYASAGNTILDDDDHFSIFF